MRVGALLLAVGLAAVLAPPAAGSFPGRNGLIAVSGEIPGSNTATIWVGRPNGSGMRALPSPCPPGPFTLADSCYPADPAWSPDGRRLAFTLLQRLQPQLWIVNADGSDLHPVPGAHGYSPAWSPDGTRLAFSVDSPEGCLLRDLYTVAPDGSSLELLVRRGDDPDWSARGEIVYERERVIHPPPERECEEAHSIAVMRPGGSPRRVALGSYPSWAPGGRAIVFAGRGGVRRKQVGARGSGRLLAGGGLVYEATWSPDGRLIAYRRFLRLRLIGARRGRPVALAFNPPGSDFSSSWQPLPR